MASRDRRLYAFAPQADPASVREAALLLLFAFTYLWFAYNRLTDSDGRGLGWIEVNGSAACARVTLVHGSNTFTDYFVLLKTADGWKIANKAFSAAVTPVN